MKDMHTHYLHRLLAAIWPLLRAGLLLGMLLGFADALGAAVIPYHVCLHDFTIPDFFWLRAETTNPFIAGTACLLLVLYGDALKRRFVLQNILPTETNPWGY